MNKNKFPKRRPTQFDVAERANVSQTLVSNILNQSTTISIPDETRERVLKVMEEIGYIPHRAARSLRTNKTYTIAAIIPDITNPFYPLFVRGIQDVTKANDYDLVIYNTDGLIEEEQNCLSSIRENRVDGLIIVPFHQTDDDLSEIDIPLIQLIQKPTHPVTFDSIFIDNVAAASEVVNHLIKRGHTRIGMIAGEEDTPPHGSRILGYKQALSENQIPQNKTLIINGEYSEAGGYQAMQKLLRLSTPVTAVFAINDLVATGALAAIREAGLQIPGDMAVAGFDDIPAARLVCPPLTTVTQDQEQLGQRAAKMLFERLNTTEPQDARAVEMPFSLIIREST